MGIDFWISGVQVVYVKFVICILCIFLLGQYNSSNIQFMSVLQLQGNKSIKKYNQKQHFNSMFVYQKSFWNPVDTLSRIWFSLNYIYFHVLFLSQIAQSGKTLSFQYMLTKSCLSAWGSSSWSGWKNIEEVFSYVILYRWCKKACVQFSPVFLHNFTLSDLFCMCCRNFQKNKNKELFGVTEAISI